MQPPTRPATGRRWSLRRLALLAVILVAAAVVGVVAVRLTSPSASKLAWSDDFTGSAGSAPDPSRWTPQIGGNGWGNHELECYTTARANSALDGHGHLVITARHTPQHACAGGTINDYTSARLMSTAQYTARYGKIEMRAKLPVQPGVWPALWGLGANQPTAGWPRCGEIDIAEVAGVHPTQVHSSVHGPTADGSPYAITKISTLSQPVSASYHVYAVAWTATSFTFSVDGRTTLSVDRAAVEQRGTWVFGKPFQLIMNVAVGGVFGGAPTGATTWPRSMSVDYVRVFR